MSQALQSVDFMAVAQETGFDNPTRPFDPCPDLVADRCTETLTPNWTHRLSGAAMFIPSHCWTMMESLRIDYGGPQG